MVAEQGDIKFLFFFTFFGLIELWFQTHNLLISERKNDSTSELVS